MRVPLPFDSITTYFCSSFDVLEGEGGKSRRSTSRRETIPSFPFHHEIAGAFFIPLEYQVDVAHATSSFHPLALYTICKWVGVGDRTWTGSPGGAGEREGEEARGWRNFVIDVRKETLRSTTTPYSHYSVTLRGGGWGMDYWSLKAIATKSGGLT